MQTLKSKILMKWIVWTQLLSKKIKQSISTSNLFLNFMICSELCADICILSRTIIFHWLWSAVHIRFSSLYFLLQFFSFIIYFFLSSIKIHYLYYLYLMFLIWNHIMTFNEILNRRTNLILNIRNLFLIIIFLFFIVILIHNFILLILVNFL